MKYGVIDVGSNSVRFMLTDGTEHLCRKTLSTTRLGEGISRSNHTLCEPAMQRTAQAIAEFASIAREQQAQVLCFATSAVREAPNRQVFLKKVFDLCGVFVDVISGDTEARLAYLGTSSQPGSGVLDIGGGSTEAIYAQNDAVYARSLKLGSVRLLYADDCRGPVNGQKLLQHADEVLAEFCIPENLYWLGVGGTITSLSAILLKLKEYDPSRVHGYVITQPALAALFTELCSLDYEKRALLPGISSKRIDTIVTGAAILLAFLRRFDIPSITASEKDGMDGYLINYLKRVD